MMKRSKVTEARRQKAADEKRGLLKNVEKADAITLSPLVFPQRYLISIENLTLSYGDRTIFDSLRFDLLQGDRVSVRGRNGSGKTSLLKLLSGENHDYAGQIQLGSNLIISTVPQDTEFLSGSLVELAESHDVDSTLYRGMLFKLGLSRLQFEKNLSDFSGGQKKKALLALSLCQKAHVYIWDEPLNYIDILSRKQLEDAILACNPTMIFVEHDRTFTQAVATKFIDL